MQQNDFLFQSAHAALVFAFNYSGQAYDRPLMNRLAAPSVGTGKGLVGLDGAAQSGIIRAEVKALGKLAEAILLARLAPRTTPCSCRSACCCGHKPNGEWTEAVSVLADHVRTTALAGCTVHGLLRREYVVRYFSPKEQRVSFERLAEKYDIAVNTASAHSSKVSQFFGGVRRGRDTTLGLEDVAKEAVEARFREIGLVGE